MSESLRTGRVQDEARRALAMQPIALDAEALELLDISATPALELLETLAPEQRKAIEGRYLEERSYPELARDLRCSESVVRKRASRGLALLRAQYGEEEAS